MTAKAAEQALNVTSAGPVVVQLTEDAASVIVGNPVHASVVLDNPRMMMINAGMPGMTNVLVLGKSGQVIFNRMVVSNAPTEPFIRIQNACINGGVGCSSTALYYCAEGERCQNVGIQQPSPASGGGIRRR